MVLYELFLKIRLARYGCIYSKSQTDTDIVFEKYAFFCIQIVMLLNIRMI